MVQKIAEMKQKRAKLVADARQILDRAEKEKRELTPEEQAQWDAMMAEVDSLKKRVDTLEQQVAAEADVGGDPEANARIVPNKEGRDGRPADAVIEQRRQAFWRAMRNETLSGEELRALNITTPAAGGYTVPNEYERTLVQKLEEENVMRRLCTVIPSISGDKIIPIESDIGQATWMGEGGAYTESDVTFAQLTLGAHKLGRIIKVSEELLNDSVIVTEAYVADVFGRTFGRAEEAACVNGDGTGKPTGITRTSQKGADAAATAITADNLVDLFHGLRAPYRAKAAWLMHDNTARAIRKLKGSDDQYLWQPGLQAGQPDTLLGKPVNFTPYMDGIATGKRSVLFGDFSYYWIADRVGRTMQRLNELYAGNGQVGFRMTQRLDGKLTLAEAVVHLLHA